MLCDEVRKIITDVDWPCEVKTLFREHNLGCRVAVQTAIDWFFAHENEGIILEDDPLISVITVVLNGKETIEETIKSALKQNYSNLEYVIIDGLSTDGTINIIREYENSIDYWKSEAARRGRRKNRSDRDASLVRHTNQTATGIHRRRKPRASGLCGLLSKNGLGQALSPTLAEGHRTGVSQIFVCPACHGN